MLNHSQSLLPVTKTRKFDDNNLIPLINVVFLLLIFFMVSGHIEQKPPAEYSTPITNGHSVATEESIHIIVDSAAHLWINNDRIGLISKLEDNKLSNIFSDFSGESKVLLSVDADIPARQLNSILIGLREQKISQIQLAVQQQ